MTRARQTLAVFDPVEDRPSLADELEGPCLLRSLLEPPEPDSDSAVHDYTLLGLEDIHLGYPGLFAADHPIHTALAQLQPGDRLTLQADDRGLVLCDHAGIRVARLSRTASAEWQRRLLTVRETRVVAMIARQADQDADAERRQLCRVRAWELPLVEVVASYPA